MSDEQRIPSYHRAFNPDPKFYGWSEWKLPKPWPIRAIIYAFVLEALTLLASFLPGSSETLGTIPWPMRVGAAGAAAWALATVRVQGRWFHSELVARVRSWRTPKHVSAWYWGFEEDAEPIQFTKVRVSGGSGGR